MNEIENSDGNYHMIKDQNDSPLNKSSPTDMKEISSLENIQPAGIVKYMLQKRSKYIY